MTALHGGAARIEVGRNIFVQAPGLVGSVELLPAELLGARGGEERATSALTDALERQQFTTLHSLEINAAPAAASSTPAKRGPDNRPVLTLEVPDIGPGQPQVVLLADEQGVITWHFAQPGPVPNTLRFDVPADAVAPAARPAGDTRGLVSVLGKKLLSVLVFRFIEAGTKVLAQHLAQRWENTHRRPGLRRFTGPGDCGAVTPIDGQGWDQLTAGRALLFIHGTCSTSQGGFGALGASTWAQLSHRYDGRLFSYDHPTLSVDPLANVDTLAGLLPTGGRLDVDIVAHSRGGLVARALACAGADASFPVHVSRIVHVGVPNAGTALANVRQHAMFVDRISTMLNLVPDGPLSVVADILDGVLTVVKIIGCNGIGELPGLSAMDPDRDWLSALGKRPVPPHTAYTVGADYEPVGALLRLVRAPDALADLVFGFAPNDMVVPAGVYDAGSAAGFPIPSERRVSFGKDENVWHCAYFGQQKTADALLGWLTADDRPEPSPL